jgi:hypothetical protein
MWATYVIFKKLPKVNSRQFGRKFSQSGHPAKNVGDSKNVIFAKFLMLAFNNNAQIRRSKELKFLL